jgi:hypothetical protein
MPSLRSSPTTLTCPTWVLAREPRDEFADITAKRRSTERSIRLGPAASHEPSMPGQQRLRLDEERVPAAPRQHSAQRREKNPIAWFKTRLFDLPAKDRQFMAEYEDLQLLRPLTTAEEHDQLQQAAADDVEGGRNQRRPQQTGTPTRPPRHEPLGFTPDRVYAPHARRPLSGTQNRPRVASRRFAGDRINASHAPDATSSEASSMSTSPPAA